jgi:hypothetical protein
MCQQLSSNNAGAPGPGLRFRQPLQPVAGSLKKEGHFPTPSATAPPLQQRREWLLPLKKEGRFPTPLPLPP